MKPPRKPHIIKIILGRLIPLVKMPVFWLISLLGNGFVAFGAVVLFYLEHDHQVKPLTLLDCVSWSVGLVTTIGYGDLIPGTDGGKILGIVMMIGGTLFLWSYMALFVGVLLAPDISLIESEIKGIKRETNLDEKKIRELHLQVASLQEKMDLVLKHLQK
jgi:Ion channel